MAKLSLLRRNSLTCNRILLPAACALVAAWLPFSDVTLLGAASAQTGPAQAPAAAQAPATAAAQKAGPAGGAASPSPAQTGAATGGAATGGKAPGPAKPATGAGAPKTAKAPPPPKPQVIPKPGPTISKAEVFSRAAPATVLLIATQDSKWQSALGTVVSPQGVVVSDTRLLGSVEKGQVYAFLYDTSVSGDEDPLLFLNANRSKALPVQVVRSDPQTHLLMLQLPSPQPKQPYKYLDLYDSRTASVGVDVVALRTRGHQTVAMMSATVAAMRSDMLELEPELTVESAGAPILTMSGRLVAVATFADKSANASGQGRPVEMIKDLLAGKLGGAPVVPSGPSAPEVATESRNAVEAVRIGLGTALASKLDKQGLPVLDKRSALTLHSQFIVAMGSRGRAVVSDVPSIELLNEITASLSKGSDVRGKVIADLFPLLVTDKKGTVFRKTGISYKAVPGSGSGIAAVDDLTGALYATDNKRQIIYFDETTKTWRTTPSGQVATLRATGGALYMLLTDGRVLTANKDGTAGRQLYPKSLSKDGSIDANQGMLYVVDGGNVFRYRDKKWDQKLKPIAFAMQRLVARGDNWYGMDQGGRIFASSAQHYIDRDGNIDAMWTLGKGLLVLTKDSRRFYYNQAQDSWSAWTQW